MTDPPRRSAVLACAAWMALAGAPSATLAAQPATPAGTPGPSCAVEPRSVASLAAAVATPRAVSSPPATPTDPDAGIPADAAAERGIRATIDELFACTNAGDYLRVYALFTDDFVRAFFAGVPLNDETLAVVAATPQPLPPDLRRIVLELDDVRLLPDGRAIATVVVEEPGPPRGPKRSIVTFERHGDRWLVADEREIGMATPTP